MEGTQATYGTQIREIEEIVRKIQAGTIDVDVLTSYVERARVLITDCRRRLSTTSATVQRIMDDVSGRAPCGDDREEGDWDPEAVLSHAGAEEDDSGWVSDDDGVYRVGMVTELDGG
jgi:exodeoxyribonuclease VII small subunit